MILRRRKNSISRRRRYWNFTLIELLVVVAVIAVISGFLLPILAAARDKARRMKAKSNERIEQLKQEELKEAAKDKLVLPKGLPPVIDQLDLNMELVSSYHRLGMDVHTRYKVKCEGNIKFHQSTANQEPTLLTILFPDDIVEARNVKLEIFSELDKKFKEPENVIYRQRGIFWSEKLFAGTVIQAKLSFTAIGRERFVYRLPIASKLRSVNLGLDLQGASSKAIPDYSLQPTSESEQRLVWKFANLVSDRPIVIDIPGAQSPMGRIMLLMRLVAVAVLLFGAGFWYLSEQYRPGLLDGFRWGHFFLLALTYSLFFIIFAVLGFQGKLSTGMAMAVAAIFSMPLLIFHVARVVNWAFACIWITPLNLFTLALVLNGVYGGDYRDYGFIAGTIVIIAYLTLTYGSWAKARNERSEARETDLKEKRKTLRELLLRDLANLLRKLKAESFTAKSLISDNPELKLNEIKVSIENESKAIPNLQKEFKDLNERFRYLPETNEFGNSFLGSYNTLNNDAKDLKERVESIHNQLKSGIEEIEKHISKLEPPILSKSSEKDEKYCLACGELISDTPFCPKCGTQQAENIHCAKCDNELNVPCHLFGDEMPEFNWFCPKCGAKL